MSKEIEKHSEGDAVITRMTLIREVNNDMCHNFYFEARFRIFTNATHYYKGNFVVWFDSQELWESLEEGNPKKERYTDKDVREYAHELAYSFLLNAPRKNINAETLKSFYEDCRETVNNYNRGVRAAA